MDLMRAALFSEHGGPEVIRISEVPVPSPGPGEVRIRVGATSLNHLDLWIRRGLPTPIPMPHIGGSDIAGQVDAMGPGVEGVSEGTRVVVDPSLDWAWYEGARSGEDLPSPRFRVLGEHTQGGLAEYTVVPVVNLMQIPEGASYDEAAAAGLVFVTAWRGLITRGKLRPGERVLITGGSGGVATAAVQIAAYSGAEVFAVTSGEENVRRLLDLGAHVVVDRERGPLGELLREATGKRRVDLVLDSVGEVVWGDLIKTLDVGGRLVTYGATTGASASTDLRHVFWKQLSILGSTMGSATEYREVMELVFAGELRPVIDRVFTLDETAEAHRLLEEGSVFGKLVVRPGD